MRIELSGLDDNEYPVEIRITDLSGRLINELRIANNTDVDAIGSQWSEGFYFMEIRGTTYRQVTRVLKSK
jgi:hypothetical protein